MIVNSYNEWDPLEEVIVGTALYARMPYDDGGMNHLEPTDRHIFSSSKERRYPDWIVQEAEEDIKEFVEVLESLGIVVRRPQPIDFNGIVKTPFWETDCFSQYAPRDIILAVGDRLIETPSPFRSRQFEALAYRPILLDYLNRGACWISAPKPALDDELYGTDSHGDPMLKEIEPAFDAANVLRMGQDLIYLVSRSGNELGARWLQQTIGDKFRVHLCRIYKGTHIDSTLALLRPGLVLANPERVTPDNLPLPLQGWDVIYSPEMEEPSYSSYQPISSKWVGMNILMLSPELAVVDEDQPRLIKLLEKHKIVCIPLKLRHARILAGGFHCITVNVRRRGNLENYRLIDSI